MKGVAIVAEFKSEDQRKQFLRAAEDLAILHEAAYYEASNEEDGTPALPANMKLVRAGSGVYRCGDYRIVAFKQHGQLLHWEVYAPGEFTPVHQAPFLRDVKAWLGLPA